MIRLTCRQCGGTGEIPNIASEICRTMQPHDAMRYFTVNREHDALEENDRTNGCAVHGRTLPGPRCDGHGVLEFDDEERVPSVGAGEEGRGWPNA
jgi:hypothetical protein